MEKFIFNVFKVIIFNVVLIVISLTALWFVQFMSAHSRYTALMETLVLDVSSNNRLNENSAEMYNSLFTGIMNQFDETLDAAGESRNVGLAVVGNGDSRTNQRSCLVSGYALNYASSGGIDVSAVAHGNTGFYSVGDIKTGTTNYVNELKTTLVTGTGFEDEHIGTELAQALNYGDVQVINLRVGYNAFAFLNNNGTIGELTNRARAGTVVVDYTYYAPCQKFIKIDERTY